MTAMITVEPDRLTDWNDLADSGIAGRPSSPSGATSTLTATTLTATTLTATTPTATTPTAARSGSAIRVAPVPRSEPPTDDELGAAGIQAPPMAALLLPLDLATGAQVRRNRRPYGRGGRAITGPGAPRRPESSGPSGSSGSSGPTEPRVIGVAGRDPEPAGPVAPGGTSPATSATGADDDVVWAGARGQSPAPTDDSTAEERAADARVAELRGATRRFLATCVEVVGGYRPLAQLRPLCLPDRFDGIVERLLRPGGCALGRGHAATRTSVVAGHDGPPRAGRTAQIARSTQLGPTERVAVRRVQICDVVDGIAEIAVVMSRRDKVWAMAVRLEQLSGRWLCTHLEVV